MKSMTGFGQSKLSDKNNRIEVSIKSLNNKFFDIKFYNHKSFMPLETQIKKLVKSKIARGSIEVFIQKKSTIAQKEKSVSINDQLALSWLKKIKALDTKLKTKSSIDLDLLIRTNPMILKKDDVETVTKQENLFLMGQIKKALEKCCIERAREGKQLSVQIKGLLKKLNVSIDALNAEKEGFNKKQAQNFNTRVKKYGHKGSIDKSIVTNEIALILEKTDILEEISRFKVHIKNMLDICAKPGSQGKSLDFYSQELLREINTIGSKSQSSKITKIVVECKGVIDQIKEQVQNIE